MLGLGDLRRGRCTTTSATKKKKVIAYAISVTGDSPGWNGIDGAAVLGHSAVRAHRNSSYDAALVAFVSPSVSEAGRHKLEKVGFRACWRRSCPSK